MYLWENRSRPLWWRRTRSLLILAAITVAVASASPSGGWHGTSLVVLVSCLPLCVTGWLTSLYAEPDTAVAVVGIGLSATAGVVLAVAVPNGASIAYVVVAVLLATTYYRLVWGIGLAAVTVTAYLVGLTARSDVTVGAAVGAAAVIGGLLLGLIRRQTDRLAVAEDRSREEQSRVAALAERARLAREIHDVLAHALSALSVQLETADALLEGGRTEQARQSVARAGRLAREGLAETRRAIGALRGDSVPLTELLDTLAAGYQTDLGAPATVRVTGTPRDLDADVALALYRTAQEAMTNVRKHAPGAPVTIDLSYQDTDVTLTVVNAPAPPGVDRPLGTVGGGYGLTGLRERAELAGGEFAAEPVDHGYRVRVRING